MRMGATGHNFGERPKMARRDSEINNIPDSPFTFIISMPYEHVASIDGICPSYYS